MVPLVVDEEWYFYMALIEVIILDGTNELRKYFYGQVDIHFYGSCLMEIRCWLLLSCCIRAGKLNFTIYFQERHWRCWCGLRIRSGRVDKSNFFILIYRVIFEFYINKNIRFVFLNISRISIVKLHYIVDLWSFARLFEFFISLEKLQNK